MSPHIKKVKPLLGAALVGALALGGLSASTFASTPITDLMEKAGFEDQPLAVCVYNAYHDATGKYFHELDNGFSYDTELAKITYMACNYNSNMNDTKISSLAGLQKLTSLQTLIFGDMPIMTDSQGFIYKFSSLSNIETLRLYKTNNRTIDLSYNTKLRHLDIAYSNIDQVFAPDSLEMLTATAVSNPFGEDAPVVNKELVVEVSNKTHLKKVDENYIYDYSSLEFLSNTNTYYPAQAVLDNDSIAFGACHIASSAGPIIALDRNCIVDNDYRLAVTTKNIINNTEYSTTFIINTNPISVVTNAQGLGIDDTYSLLDNGLFFFGEDFDTDDYVEEYLNLAKAQGKIIDHVEVIPTNAVGGNSIGGYAVSDGTDATRIIGSLTNEDATILAITYYFKEESAEPKTPNTGLFTKEDGGVNVANIAIVLAGLSILTFIILGLRSRLSARSRIHKF